jgi:hypothetical protein
MYVYRKNMKNKQKEWHCATKPLKYFAHFIWLNPCFLQAAGRTLDSFYSIAILGEPPV